MVVGAFKNPPKFAPVPYADDLARCQRYYQAGYFSEYGKAAKQNSTRAIWRKTVDFPVKMASAPTISQTGHDLKSLSGSGVQTPIPGATLTASASSGGDCFWSTLDVTDGTHGPNLFNNGFLIQSSWTAEVV